MNRSFVVTTLLLLGALPAEARRKPPTRYALVDVVCQGEPILTATVVDAEGTEWHRSADGLFHFPWRPSPNRADSDGRAIAPGFKTTGFRLPEPSLQATVVGLQPADTVRGTVVDSSGHPARGAWVRGHERDIPVDDDGRFTIAYPSSDTELDTGFVPDPLVCACLARPATPIVDYLEYASCVDSSDSQRGQSDLRTAETDEHGVIVRLGSAPPEGSPCER